MKKNILFYLMVAMIVLNIGCTNHWEDHFNNEKGNTSKCLPKFTGKLIYHNYSSYLAEDSKMWLYDFDKKTLNNISSNWGNVKHPMNAHFSPDGKKIVFMGIGNDAWNVYLYELNTQKDPENLTPDPTTRDEDPKYSPDGKKIIFKRNGKLVQMDLDSDSREIEELSDGSIEYSMPYYNADGTKLVFSAGDGENSSILMMDLKTKSIQTLYDAVGIQDYYPINADATSFYYSRGYSQSNPVDQVYRGYWDKRTSVRLPFNALDGDYSDAYPIDDDWVMLSYAEKGTDNYDLYVANVNTGEKYSMSNYHSRINTSTNELGACVYIPPTPKINNKTLSASGRYYYASIYFKKNDEVVISGITNIDEAYNRDFLEYNSATGKYKFTGESGNWDVYYSSEYNYIWITRKMMLHRPHIGLSDVDSPIFPDGIQLLIH